MSIFQVFKLTFWLCHAATLPTRNTAITKLLEAEPRWVVLSQSMSRFCVCLEPVWVYDEDAFSRKLQAMLQEKLFLDCSIC